MRHDDIWTAHQGPLQAPSYKKGYHMYKNMRMMTNHRWELGVWLPGAKQICQKLQQSAMEPWPDKTQVMAILTHTQETKPIHPLDRAEILTPQIKLKEQWVENHALQEQKMTQENITKNQHADKCAKQ